MKLTIVIFFILISSSLSFAEQSLSWDQCQAIAKENNQELKIAREKINEIKKQKAITATSEGFSVDSSASIRRSGSSNDTSDTNSTGLGLSSRKLLYDGDYTKNSIAAAEENIKYQEYNNEITEANVRLTLRRYFCEALRTQQLIELSRIIAERRKTQLDLVNLRYNAGLEHKGSYLTAYANLNEVLNNLGQEKRNLQINYQKLIYVMGVSGQKVFNVTENISLVANIKNRPIFTDIVEETPLLKEVISQRIQNKYSVEMYKANYLPDVYFSGSINKNYTNQDSTSNENDSWSAGVNLSFNLYDSNKKKYELEKAQSQLIQSEINIEDNQHSIALTLQETWNNLINSVENIEVAKDFLIAREERSTIAAAQYSSGLISFDNWIIIEDDLIRAQKSYINNKIDALIKEANWINAKGGGFDEK